MNPLIIGFGHKARNGKDEAIKAIINNLNSCVDVLKYGFGDALKREVSSLARNLGGMQAVFSALPGLTGLEIPPSVVFDAAAPMDDPLCPYGKQRTLLQFYGTEFRRAQDPDYWVKKLFTQIYAERPAVALICDLRFPNEFARIKQVGGYTVKVVRTGFVSDVPEHHSEKALDHVPDLDWDYVISVPDGRLDLLKEEAVNAFNFIDAVHRTQSL